MILCTKTNLAPEDITIQVNNGEYDHKTDYSDERFKESYLMTHNGKVAYGYDCLVRNNKGEAVAWVEAHYFDGWSDPFRVSVYGLKADSYSFPVEFFYRGVLLKKCEVTVALSENHQSIEKTINEVHSIEKQCWTSNMTQHEKLKAFAQYVANNYSYNELGWLPETKFEDGIKKTIQWYLDNKDWWQEIISGEYQNYYEKMYGNR